MTFSRFLSFLSIALLLCGLIAVRAFEDVLFQDPLQDYFLGSFQYRPIPELHLVKQLALTSFRFLINMVLSIWILWYLYKKESYLNASLWVYLISFIVLTVTFAILLEMNGDFAKMALFYVRRFLIHPLLLFVLVAGFYFLKNKSSSKI